MEMEGSTKEFRPELLSRRGEMFAWLTALLTFAGWLILKLTGRPVISAVVFMAFFFLFVALSISLGNWMDRRTVLQIGLAGVSFKNGLRDVKLAWEDIQQVEVLGSSWGRKVRVYGATGHFDFRTLGEFKMNGQVKGRLGFVEGELILQQILDQSGLKQVEHSHNSYYYARR